MSFFVVCYIITLCTGKEATESEKGHEQGIAGQRGCLLEPHEAAGETECRNSVPQMKGLKKLMLLVSNIRETDGQGQARHAAAVRPDLAVSVCFQSTIYKTS